jgi:hypothetical protein
MPDNKFVAQANEEGFPTSTIDTLDMSDATLVAQASDAGLLTPAIGTLDMPEDDPKIFGMAVSWMYGVTFAGKSDLAPINVIVEDEDDDDDNTPSPTEDPVSPRD